MARVRGGKDKFITGTSKKMSSEFLTVMEALLKECEEGKITTKYEAVTRRNELVAVAFAPAATADVDID